MIKLEHFFKNNFKYVLVFILVIAIYQFFGFGINYGDPLANYGFSYAIIKGQIPYVDFNTISTPLFAFYGAIGLLFWNNYLMFIIEQALLVTVTFFFLYKLYDKKSYLVLAVLVGLNFYGILATYNFMCFAMMVVILYLEEKYNDKDYLIGFFIGLAILTKHTVGCFFILPTFIRYFGNWKKIGKRALGCLIPGSIFIIYLIVNGALFKFVDLCFLGLFDFSSSNGHPFNTIFYISILFLALGIFITCKKYDDIKNYYLLSSFFFLVPIFDYCHFSLFFAAIIMMMIPYLKCKDFYITLISVSIIVCSLVFSMKKVLSYDLVFTSKYKHFEYSLHVLSEYEKSLEISKFLNSYDDPIILSYFTMQYDIINDNELDYYDVLLYGNFGYDGINKMLKEFKKMNDKIFIVSRADYENDYEYSQFAKELVDYVVLNGKLIDSKYEHDVYYVE